MLNTYKWCERKFLPLHARIAQNLEDNHWPKGPKYRSDRFCHHICRHRPLFWRNAKTRKLFYKAHRHCSAGRVCWEGWFLRQYGIWPWQATQMTRKDFENLPVKEYAR
jgi:hypothetical protein